MATRLLGRAMTGRPNPRQRPFAVAMGLIFGLTVAGLVPLVLAQPGRAANVALPLFASAAGWGSTSGGEANPGPTFVVYRNDQIDVTLTSDDGLPHGLWIDYNGDGIPNSGDYISPKTSATQNPIQFSFPADVVGQFTYYDQSIPLNTGTWSTRANGAPSGTFRAPASGTSWTGGKAHDISFDLTDPDGDPMTYTLTYSYGGGARQTNPPPPPASPQPKIVSLAPTGVSATHTAAAPVDPPSRGGTPPPASLPL